MAATVVCDDAALAAERLREVENFMLTVEARLSRFRPESELSRLNARTGRETAVSPLLWVVLEEALRAAEATAGLYDPTILNALEAAGYDRSFEQLSSCQSQPDPRSDSCFDWRDIRLDPERRAVTLPLELRVDLGGIAKGLAADWALQLLSGLGPALIDAGGDLAASGCQPGLSGWLIAIADPLAYEQDLALVILRDRGLATSGLDYRCWVSGGQPQHHLIDPRTGRPAETDLLAVSVIAPTTRQADVEAKVALLLGSEKGLRHLDEQRDLEALLVRQDGTWFTTAGFERFLYSSSAIAP